MDKRTAQLSNLSKLHVPVLSGSVTNLVKLRENDDAFAKWRYHLSVALSAVGDVADDQSSIKEATEIVASGANGQPG